MRKNTNARIILEYQDGEEKQFLYRHSRTCFELLDEDGSRRLSENEFQKLGFLFGFGASTIHSIIEVLLTACNNTVNI